MGLREFYKDKVVLVTGHTGFKGAWLTRMLVGFGAKVIGYSLNPPTNPNLFNLDDVSDKIADIRGDIRDFDKLLGSFKKYKPDIVIHLAAQPIVLDSYKEPRYTYETNVMGTVNVLEAARLTGCCKSILNVTTDKVYENNDLPTHLFREDEKLDGYDPYSNSKSCSELVTHSYKKSFFVDGKGDCAISTARAGNVIGGGDFSPNRIIPDCVRAVEKGEEILVRNRHSTRPYQFVLEPLYGYLLIAMRQYEDKGMEGYYNIGPDPEDFVSTGDLVNLFCSKWGKGATWKDKTVEGAPHEAAFLALDNSLVKEKFGWKPSYHIDQDIEQVVEWTKLYFEDKTKIPSLMDEQINKYLEKAGANK